VRSSCVSLDCPALCRFAAIWAGNTLPPQPMGPCLMANKVLLTTKRRLHPTIKQGNGLIWYFECFRLRCKSVIALDSPLLDQTKMQLTSTRPCVGMIEDTEVGHTYFPGLEPSRAIGREGWVVAESEVGEEHFGVSAGTSSPRSGVV